MERQRATAANLRRGSRLATITRGGALAAVGIVALSGLVYGANRVAGAPSNDGWYDATSLLVSLRSEARAALTQAVAPSSLEDLTFYDLDLAYDPSAATFALKEDVWFTNTTTESLPDLVFRIYANAAPPDSGPQVHFVSGACSGAARCGFSMVTPSALRVQLGTPLAPGGRVRLKVAFNGALTHIDSSRTNFMSQSMEGMKSLFGGGSGGSSGGAAGGDYGLLAVGDGIVSFGNFYPVLARRMGGGWETDEVSKLGDLGSDDIASFRARIELPGNAKLAVAGVVTSEQALAPYPGGAPRRQVNVVAAGIRDFALLFGDGMDVSTRDVHGVHVRSYYLKADRASGVKVLDVAAHALEDFERRFGPYPYADYDVSEAAIVGGAGGVEFSGLVTAASMFYRPMSTGGGGDGLAGLMGQLGGGAMSGMTDGMLEFVVAHETAHQWWHGLVGSDSRDHPYVDEALAQYSSIIYLEDRYGPARAEKDGASNVKMNFQTMRLLGKSDAPADQPVSSYSASAQYAGVIYGKAPYLYKAIRSAIGDAAFFADLRAYVTKYRFAEAPARGLVDLLAAGNESKVRPLERRWLDETHGDEDLGSLDMSSMLGGMTGGAGGLGGAAGAMPDMGELEQVMQMLQGAGGGFGGGGSGGTVPTAPGTPATPGAPGPGDPDVGELLKMLGGQ